MAQKPKVGKAKVPPDKAKAQEKTQSERFIETARSIGVDESGREFDKALRRLVPRRPTRVG
jgi:hypothetical protein